MNYLAFNKQWFKNHQAKLVWLLNAPLIKYWFRWVMCIDQGDRVDAILPNSTFRIQGEQIVADFRTHWKYSKRLYYAFKPLWWAMHYWDELFADWLVPKLSFGFLTLTAFPDPDVETSTVDGYSGRVDTGIAFATTHDNADGTTADDAGTLIQCQCTERVGGTLRYTIHRGFLLFDTSALTASASISAAVLSLNPSNAFDGDNDAQGYSNIYSSTPASNTAIGTADYDQVGTTAFATAIDTTNIVTGSYNDWTFNATGRAAISLTSISKFGFREGHDAENTAPANDTTNGVQAQSADNAGTTSDPKLVVTYTLPSGFISSVIFM